MELYLIWFIAAVVLVVVEIFTPGFAVLCLAIGALGAGIIDLCGLSLNIQLITMLVLTVLSFIFVRPFALKYLNKKKDEVVTNADAIIGKKGVVTEIIDASNNTGRIKIDGDFWKAVSHDGAIIEIGKHVEILSRDSLILTVKACDL